MKKLLSLASLTFAFSLAANSTAQACAACYGDTSGSKMGNAAAIGIFAMVVIMFIMLGAVAAFGFHLRRLEKNPLPDYSELLEETPPDAKPPGDDKPGTSS